MKVAVTGSHGFVGRALVAALLERGDRVVPIGRDPQPEDFAGVDAVVHLAGEPVSGRWTEAKKRAIRDSRIEGSRRLIEALGRCSSTPRALVAASAVGYYGARGDEPLFESASAGSDFLSEVCAGWETAVDSARLFGIRTAQLRTGIVLGDGGALAAMAVPFKLGLGGPFGSGRQFVPWIHIDDLVALYLFALDNDVSGAINAVTPDYATSSRFSQALGTALRRPALLPAPGFALRVVLGEFANTLLTSQLVIPARASDAGFTWQHPILEMAMAHAVGSRAAGSYGVETFETSQIVHAPLEDVFAFFSNPRNLDALTPSTLRFGFRVCPDTVERGSHISYELRLHGVPMSWDTLIAHWEPPHRFVDVQLHGPYASWHHEHTFEEFGDGVKLTDRVRYVLPFAPLGALVKPLVGNDVRAIFAYRRAAIAARFPHVQREPAPSGAMR